ncbi:MAG TPA: 16S rRNA (adenine(1518)-N(6)/adenine(1519)-N(6))-dimethyltransferase RsmA [Actinomycetota bacterium]|nr:16S rRNA (adenine(1518)-N(6)/adenine(1519)-N(6))-dimethyltransferase RsmA [Actinomycetota bacterium]
MTSGPPTATTARDLLDRHGLHTRRSLGQHFLVDPNTVRKIMRLSGVRDGDTVLEVGPGIGSLTSSLAAVAARVVAVEVDEAVVPALREVISGFDNVDLVVGDALRIDLEAAVGGDCRMISNLPYNVATPIMARVLDEVPAVRGGLVMVQRELGERWTAPPGSRTYGAISVKFAYHAQARVAAEVSRHVFMPPPKVSSVLVDFRRLDAPAVDVGPHKPFLDFVSRAFGHRRKTIRNALVSAGLDSAVVETALSQAAIAPASRPEVLDLDDYARLYRAMGQ